MTGNFFFKEKGILFILTSGAEISSEKIKNFVGEKGRFYKEQQAQGYTLSLKQFHSSSLRNEFPVTEKIFLERDGKYRSILIPVRMFSMFLRKLLDQLLNQFATLLFAGGLK